MAWFGHGRQQYRTVLAESAPTYLCFFSDEVNELVVFLRFRGRSSQTFWALLLSCARFYSNKLGFALLFRMTSWSTVNPENVFDREYPSLKKVYVLASKFVDSVATWDDKIN